MKEHVFHLHDEPFNKILIGRKTVECRLYDEKRKQIQIGDNLIFERRINPLQKITAKVIGLYCYGTFSELFTSKHQLFFGVPIDELNDSMVKYYTPEDEARYGVIGIEFKILSSV